MLTVDLDVYVFDTALISKLGSNCSLYIEAPVEFKHDKHLNLVPVHSEISKFCCSSI